MIEHNTFCDAHPQEDTICGCAENYDLSDWNDVEPEDWEAPDAPAKRSCQCMGEDGDEYANALPEGCRGCCREPLCSKAAGAAGDAGPAPFFVDGGSYEDQIIEI